MARPLVSYVVTLYDKARFLPYTLAGLRAQEGPFEQEFVFVDDGSRDDTLARLRALTADWPLTTILTQANAGPAAALNRGLAAVRGEFIKPMDGDDVLLPWGTRRLLDALAATGCGVATARYLEQPHYRPEGEPAAAWAALRDAAAPAERWDMLPASLRRCETQPSLWLARAEAVRAAGGCDPGVFVQDYSLELRLAALGPVARVPGPVVLIADAGPGRLSDNEAQALHDGNFSLLRFLRARPDLPSPLRRLALRRAAGRALRWARRHGAAGATLRPLAASTLAACGLLRPGPWAEAAVCAPFRDTHPIRVPGQPAAASAARSSRRKLPDHSSPTSRAP